MKANEAPEKIYLYTEGHTLDNDWLYEASEEFESFEYTRTDAFIEKACKYSEPIIFSMNLGDRPDTDKFIENFRNYMKGE